MIRKYIFLVFLIIPFVSYAQVDSTENKITFRVISSKLIPYAAKIHITGNHPQLLNWASPGIPLEELSDSVWEKTFSFKTGTLLEYDFNLGSFESIGLDSSGKILGDSIFHTGNINQHSHSFLEVKIDTTVIARIPQWRQGEIHLFADNLDTVSAGLDVLWKYHSGDNEEWANPDFDDSSWELVRSVLRPNELPKNGWQGVGWFRLHIVFDSTFIKPLGLSIMQAGASQLYLDGTLIYTFGEHSDDWTGAPKVLIFDGKKRHVIAVRYSNLTVNKFHSAAWSAGFALQLGNIDRMAEDRIRTERIFIGYQMFFTSLPLGIGLLYLILFAFSPGLRQNLYFALFLFSFAATVFFDYQASLSTHWGQTLFYLRMHRAVNILFALFLLRFLYSLFYKAVPKQFWIISLVAFSFGALAIYKPNDNFELYNIAIGLTVGLESIRVIILALFKKKKGAWIIALAFLVFWIFGALDQNEEGPFGYMQNPYAFGSIGFIIAMSVYLSRDFVRSNKKIVEQEMEQKLLEAENARQSKELEEARQLQLSMLPKELPQLPHLDIGVFMKTATEVGGDYYDFHLADNGILTVAIGDATGHGMKAGTMVSVIKSLFIAEASQTDILSFFIKCTQTIKQMRLGSLYMAMMLIKIKDLKMTVSSAGIPPIYIYRSETKSVEEILIKGMPLGGPASFPYKKRETNLSPGDTVLLMSDGFPELFNDKNEMLDYPRVKEIFKEAAESSVDEIVAHLFKAGEKWSNGRPQDDDITFGYST